MVGAGNISETHVTRYEKNPNVEVVAVCDIDEAKLNEYSDAHNIPHRFTSIDEMLASVELDAADVCVWNCSHAECSIAALNAGKHVLLEKPMALVEFRVIS